MKFLHLGDLHLSVLSMPISSIFTKRLFGHANYVLNRQFKFEKKDILKGLKQIVKQNWNYILITGDITQTSQKKSFSIAKQILHPLIEQKRLLIIPGNHDRYLEQDKTLFEEFYGDCPGIGKKFELAEWDLGNNIVLLAVEMCMPTSFLKADGKIKPDTLKKLENRLFKLQEQNREIWLAGHFPLKYPKGYEFNEDRALQQNQREYLINWTKAFNIRYYFHGHEHKWWIETAKWGTHFINSGSFGKNRVANAWINGRLTKIEF